MPSTSAFYFIPMPVPSHFYLIIKERGWREVVLNIVSPGTALPVFTGIFNANPGTIFNLVI
jgi:hypothetical protein